MIPPYFVLLLWPLLWLVGTHTSACAVPSSGTAVSESAVTKDRTQIHGARRRFIKDRFRESLWAMRNWLQPPAAERRLREHAAVRRHFSKEQAVREDRAKAIFVATTWQELADDLRDVLNRSLTGSRSTLRVYESSKASEKVVDDRSGDAGSESTRQEMLYTLADYEGDSASPTYLAVLARELGPSGTPGIPTYRQEEEGFSGIAHVSLFGVGLPEHKVLGTRGQRGLAFVYDRLEPQEEEQIRTIYPFQTGTPRHQQACASELRNP